MSMSVSEELEHELKLNVGDALLPDNHVDVQEAPQCYTTQGGAAALYLLGLASILAACVITLMAYLETRGDLRSWTAMQWSSWVTGMWPLVTAEIWFGIPSCRAAFIRFAGESAGRRMALPLALALSWLCMSATMGRFNPLSFALICFTFVSCVSAVHQARSLNGGKLNWVDVIVWLIMWTSIDLRFYDKYLYLGVQGQGYQWWSAAWTVILILAFICHRRIDGLSFRLIPHWKDPLLALGCLVAEGVVIVPVGIVTKFLVWPPPPGVTALFVIGGWLENVFTIALTEELFFRGILYNGVRELTGRRWVAVIFASLCFGLMHWVRLKNLTFQFAYVAFAALAGALYNGAYILSGNSIICSVLAHSITDTAWGALLGGGF